MTVGIGTEARLAAAFLRNGGAPRAALVAVCTALVSGLLLVALAVLRYGTGSPEQRYDLNAVSNLVADDGVRGGYVFALVLICLAPLALLRQVVRLGSAAREQRLAALLVAGATPAEVRRVGALEVGVPATVGGLLGFFVYRGLGWLLDTVAAPQSGLVAPAVGRELRLVPTAVGPAWWQVLLVALGVGLVGALTGLTAARALDVAPLGVSRRAPRPAPRPWVAVLLLAGAALLLLGASTNPADDDVYVFGALGSLVLGLLALTPWVAHRAARLVAARSTTVPALLAARRLTADARPAGRAAAAVGVIAMIAGFGGGLLTDLLLVDGSTGQGGTDPMYTVPVVLVGVVLLVALVLVVFSMAVHGVETLLDRKRSTASLAAMGMSTDELAAIQRWEVRLVAVPMALLGVVVGSGLMALLISSGGPGWIPLVVDLATIALVWLSVLASTRLTRPWLRQATAPENLRTA